MNQDRKNSKTRPQAAILLVLTFLTLAAIYVRHAYAQ